MELPIQGRDFLIAAGGVVIGMVIAQSLQGSWRRKRDLVGSKHSIRTIKELRAVLPAGGGGSNVSDALKVRSDLDEQMVGFIARSPFLQLATANAIGLPFVSPKGDAPGFVEVVKNAKGQGVAVLIPDRPGNRLLFGLQNVIEGTGQVGLCFVIPGNDTTLRCGGRATLSQDPETLRRLSARGRDAKMVIRVEVDYAFFHCAKAYMRSKLWEPASWPSASDKYKICFGAYFADCEKKSMAIDAAIDQEYDNVAKSIKGEAAEPE
jgi:PPOX class probable FMN-dependent enzyme